MVETDWAWFAGLVDGEGCLAYGRFNARNGRPGYSARLAVSMYSRRAIDKAIRIVAELGLGPPNLHERIANGGKLRFDLTIQGAKAAVVIGRLLPYLTTKVAEAELLLEALAVCPPGRGQCGQYLVRSPEQMALQEGYHLALKEAKVQALAVS